MKRRNQQGLAMVEFAITATVLFILLFAIIEFSVILFDKAVITNASREGARRGIVYNPDGTSTDEIKNTVMEYVQDKDKKVFLISLGSPSNFGNNKIQVNPVDCLKPRDLTACPAGTPLTVSVDYEYHFLILPHFVTQLAGLNPLTLSATTVMRME